MLDNTLNGTEAAEVTTYKEACSTVCPYCAGRGLHYVGCADRKRAVLEALQPLLFAKDVCATCGAVGLHPYGNKCKACVIAEDVIRRSVELEVA
jgi:hypothetical protein